MGSNQFSAIIDKFRNITLTIIDGPDVGNVYQLNTKSKTSIGRKPTN